LHKLKNSIVKTIELKSPVARVWHAITDFEEFGQWFQVAIDGPFVVGEVSTGQMLYPGFEHFRWYATVKAMETEKYFSFTWCPYSDNPDADYSKEPTTLVEFHLEPTDSGTRLTVEESGFADLPADHRREKALKMNTRGWEACMKAIESHVGG
jgi:uncharacterized protein YndB with AHSA1/START domain